MKATRNRKMNRKPTERRADTAEARAKQAEHRQRRLFPVEGESPRSRYGHWLNDFLADPQPAPPYALGRQYARRFLSQVRTAHQATLAGF